MLEKQQLNIKDALAELWRIHAGVSAEIIRIDRKGLRPRPTRPAFKWCNPQKNKEYLNPEDRLRAVRARSPGLSFFSLLYVYVNWGYYTRSRKR